MNRKQFVESNGATCQNWMWSWSFINKEKKVVIFGAWDHLTKGKDSLIFSTDWEFDDKKHKKPGYAQSMEHIRLIEEEGYQLVTFPIIFSAEKQDAAGNGPAKIKDFIKELTPRKLKQIKGNWYATDDGVEANLIPEEVVIPEQYMEGASKTISVNIYERNAEARAKCLAHYGYECSVCSFSFEKAYGEVGERYIHVHHLVPLSEIKKEYGLDPIKDLRPICPNCHAIIHRKQPAMSVAELKSHIKTRKRIANEA